jgi:hypothetical protein
VGIGDVAGAFVMEGAKNGIVALGGSSQGSVLWSRAENFLWNAAGSAVVNPSTSADIGYKGKLIRAQSPISIYLIVPSIATTTVQYGVQVTFNYWTLASYKSQAAINSTNTFLNYK